MNKIIDKQWQLAALAIFLLILIGLFFPFDARDRVRRVTLSFRPDTMSIKEGDSLPVNIYLDDNGVGIVTAVDIRVNFDHDSLSLISAKPGEYFMDPLILKWEEETAWFSLARIPSRVSRVQAAEAVDNLALIELEFLATSADSDVSISFGEESRVYVYRKGGVYPQVFPGYYQISNQ